MDYKNAREWVESTKQYGSLLGLDSIRELMHRLGDVQDTLAVIHVAGTNGKGSTCTMLASIYEQAGYRVGRYSSPAVFSPTGRSFRLTGIRSKGMHMQRQLPA